MNKEFWSIIANPNAGKRVFLKQETHIRQQLALHLPNHKLFLTNRKKHATYLAAQQIKSGKRNFIIIGGDGTLNEVVNGIMSNPNYEQKATIAMLPMGTGNDWCRMHNITNNTETCLQAIKNSQIEFQDIGKVSFVKNGENKTRYFINIAGIGFDAVVANKTNKLKEKFPKGGKVFYLSALIQSLVKYKAVDLKIESNGDLYNTKIFSLGIGIGAYKGGGMKQIPHAVTNDGEFSISLIHDIPKHEVIRNIKNLYDGSYIKHPFVKTFNSKSIKINSSSNCLLEADGEILGKPPYTFEIIQNGIAFIKP